MARYFLIEVPDVEDLPAIETDRRQIQDLVRTYIHQNASVVAVEPHHAPGVPVDVFYAGEFG